MRTQIMYIQSKTEGLAGPARIGRVSFSKTGRTIYCGGKAFQSLKGAGFKASMDVRREYWTSIRAQTIASA